MSYPSCQDQCLTRDVSISVLPQLLALDYYPICQRQCIIELSALVYYPSCQHQCITRVVSISVLPELSASVYYSSSQHQCITRTVSISVLPKLPKSVYYPNCQHQCITRAVSISVASWNSLRAFTISSLFPSGLYAAHNRNYNRPSIVSRQNVSLRAPVSAFIARGYCPSHPIFLHFFYIFFFLSFLRSFFLSLSPRIRFVNEKLLVCTRHLAPGSDTAVKLQCWLLLLFWGGGGRVEGAGLEGSGGSLVSAHT